MNKLKSLRDICNKYNYILTKSQKRWGVVVIIMTLIGSICEMLGVSVILPLVQVMIAPEQLMENVWVREICAFFDVQSKNSLIWLIGCAVVLVYILKNFFLLFLSFVRVKYACKVQRELSIEMLQSYIKRGYIFFLSAKTGELIRGMLTSISYTYNGLYQLFKLFAEVLTIFFICIYIMLSDIFMAVCVALLAVICLLVVVLVCQKWIKRSSEIFYKYTALLNKTFVQLFQGIKEVLVMNKEDFFVDTYRDQYQKQQKGYIGQTVASESPIYIIEAICVAGLIIMVCMKAISIDEASTLVPQLATFAVAAFRILPSLGRISSYFNQFLFCVVGINDTYDNLNEVREKQQDSYELIKEREKCRLDFSSQVSIENITWKYPEANNNVLEDVTFSIEKGQSVAFVGKSGAGKTTLADIILGLLIPQKGTIKIDGVDISEIANKSHLVGFVPQTVNLLDDTVRRNVAFGVKDEEIDDERVWEALRQAQLKEVVEGYSKGLDTEIGERGNHFSGGQRQRLAIARAMYNDPGIIILDEATSALDTETETAVMEAINALQGQKTLIIIAHRLTTVQKCDKIYEIVDGKAILRSYEEL